MFPRRVFCCHAEYFVANQRQLSVVALPSTKNISNQRSYWKPKLLRISLLFPLISWSWWYVGYDDPDGQKKTWVLDKAWAGLINNWTQVSTQTIYQKKWVLFAISYNNCWAIWLQSLHILQKKMNYILIKKIVLLFQFPLWSPFPVKLFSFCGQCWLENT